ncbi:MarR family transcriptional regulator [Nocardia sp. NPDC051787]|uniref:MarR family winged helix-turn-helix transcriptional regulator n=1 Tax=Nocardia sp. NPDC051787 TaxID=3155415 RepID=UPI003445AAAD
MSDAVDLFVAHWHRERPEVDVSPMLVLGRIQRLARLVEQDLKRFFGEFGLEFWEFDVLATLRRSGGADGLTAGALIKVAMVTSGAITNRIDRLAAKGLVERKPCPEDRRAIRVRLTEQGRALIDDLLPRHMANEQRLLAALDISSREQLADLLRALAESLGDTPPE